MILLNSKRSLNKASFLLVEKGNDTENSLFKRFGTVPSGTRKKVKKVLEELE